MKSHTVRYRIQTCDVDIRKSYKAFSFMTQAQEIANYHASSIGFGYSDLIKDNIVWVLSRMKVVCLRSPKWEDEVELTTWHKGREGVFSLRDFEVSGTDGGGPLIQATSSWLLIDVNTRRMLRPDHILGEKSLTTALDRNAIAEACGKLTTPSEGMELVRTHEVLYSDIDFNAHTNNAKYIEWAFDTLPFEAASNKDIDEFQINFNHETRPGDNVELLCGITGPESFFIEGMCDERSVFQCSIKLKS